MRHIETVKKFIMISMKFLNPVTSNPIQIGIPKNTVVTNKIATAQLIALQIFMNLRFTIIYHCLLVAYWKREIRYKLGVYSGFAVRIGGLEPPRLTTLDPKSSAATNYAICAQRDS